MMQPCPFGDQPLPLCLFVQVCTAFSRSASSSAQGVSAQARCLRIPATTQTVRCMPSQVCSVCCMVRVRLCMFAHRPRYSAVTQACAQTQRLTPCAPPDWFSRWVCPTIPPCLFGIPPCPFTCCHLRHLGRLSRGALRCRCQRQRCASNWPHALPCGMRCSCTSPSPISIATTAMPC